MLKSLLYHLNHLNPNKPKTNYLKLAKAFVAIFILISITIKIIPILAQESEPTQDTIDTSAYDQFVDQNHEAKQNISAENWNANMFDTTAINICDALSGQCPTTTNITENISQNGIYIPGGMLGITNNLIAQTYTPPASGVQYLAQLKDNSLLTLKVLVLLVLSPFFPFGVVLEMLFIYFLLFSLLFLALWLCSD